MKLTLTNQRTNQGFSLVELLIASAISVMTLGSLMALFLQVAKEQARGATQTLVQHKASQVQQILSRHLKSMSREHGVVFAEEDPHRKGLYRKLLVSRSSAFLKQTAEVEFSEETHVLVVRTAEGNEWKVETLDQPVGHVVIRDCLFHPAIQSSGLIDNTTVNVVLEIDDAGPTSFPAAPPYTNSCTRTFSIKLRQP